MLRRNVYNFYKRLSLAFETKYFAKFEFNQYNCIDERKRNIRCNEVIQYATNE